MGEAPDMSLARYFDRIDLGLLAKFFGVDGRPLKVEDTVQKIRPSPVAVHQFENEIVGEADRIEQLFLSIYRKLLTMDGWQRRGLVEGERQEQAKEWFLLRMRALPLLLWRYGVLDDTFSDGAGI